MKIISNAKTVVLSATVCLLLAACSNENENAPPITIHDIEGNYTGMMSVNQTAGWEGNSETVSKSSVSSVVDENSVYFADFPVYSIIAAIEGREAAEEISKTVITDYQMGIEGEVIEEQTRIKLSLTPPPLRFLYSLATPDGVLQKRVTVYFATNIKTSGYSSGKMQLSIVAEEVRVNDQPLFVFGEQYIKLDMNKQL